MFRFLVPGRIFPMWVAIPLAFGIFVHSNHILIYIPPLYRFYFRLGWLCGVVGPLSRFQRRGILLFLVGISSIVVLYWSQKLIPHCSLGVRDVYPRGAATCPKTWYRRYWSRL